MVRPLVVAACVVMLASPLRAQHSAGAAPAADPAEKQFLGTWDGTFQTHGPQGRIRLTFAKDTVVTVKMEIIDQSFSAGASGPVRVDRNSVAWPQSLMGRDCKSSAVLVDGLLDGEVACEHGTLTFSLKKS